MGVTSFPAVKEEAMTAPVPTPVAGGTKGKMRLLSGLFPNFSQVERIKG